MIVVDTNVLVHLHLVTRATEAALDLFSREPSWAVPPLWRSEFRNVLAGQVRRREITFEQACRVQSEAENLLEGCEFPVTSTSVLALARDSGCTAYDCEFVALAVDLDTILVTRDEEILRAFPDRAVSLSAARR